MRIFISIAAALLSAVGIGGVATTQNPSINQNETKPAVITTVKEDRNERTPEDSWMREHRDEYEDIIDEEVEKGNLSDEDAEAYKSDFYAMQDYCNRVRGNNSRSGMRTRGCH